MHPCSMRCVPPLFMEYYRQQPFNANHLMPCPMLENPDVLPKMVEESGAVSTDLVEKESPDQLRDKTREYAQAWKRIAERLWNDPDSPLFEKRQDPTQGMAATDLSKQID